MNDIVSIRKILPLASACGWAGAEDDPGGLVSGSDFFSAGNWASLTV
jgi:hypothetical protein